MIFQYVFRDTPEDKEHLCVYLLDGKVKNILIRNVDATELNDEQLDELARKTLEDENEAH